MKKQWQQILYVCAKISLSRTTQIQSASGLAGKTEPRQVYTMLCVLFMLAPITSSEDVLRTERLHAYCMAEEAGDVLTSTNKFVAD